MSTSSGRTEYARQSWPAAPRAAAEIAVVVRDWLGSLAVNPDTAARLAAAVDEAVVNAYLHAYPAGRCGSVEITLWTDSSAVHVEVLDHGSWRAPPSTAGRGMQVMARLDEQVLIRFNARGTRVLLRQPLKRSAQPRRPGTTAPALRGRSPSTSSVSEPP